MHGNTAREKLAVSENAGKQWKPLPHAHLSFNFLDAMSGARKFHCYTDGSCKAAPGAPGGWGFVIKQPGLPTLESYGSARGTLAKVMEYRAVAEALAVLPAGATVVVFCDNQSLVENLNHRLSDWRNAGFANVDAQIVDSVRHIARSISERALTVRWQWLRAHNGNAGNERADELAAQGAREAKAKLAASSAAKRR